MNFPKPMCRRGVAAVLAAAAMLTAAPRAHAQGWWNTAWRYRRAVTLENYQPTRLGGDDIAVVTVLTGGHARPDGGDIRVATTGRTEVPSRVLMVGPGDRVKVAFAIRGAGSRYYVYSGNPKAPAPAKPLEIRRGVLQETWTYTGGGIKTLSQVRSVFDKARRLLGRDFRDRVFVGHNPFGPDNRIASRFTAYLNCPADGQYNFACSSQDASFLLIDDKTVVENGGNHLPQRNIRQRGSARLTKGLHKLTFYHVNATGNPIAVAAWQAPGDKRVWPIPAAGFAPVFQAKPGAMEQYGKSVGIDFLARHGGEVFSRNRYYQRWTFAALTVGSLGRDVSLVWDFGDGQRAGTPTAEHIYLTPGEYTVTLSAKTYQGQLTRSNRIVVERPWDTVATNRLDSLADHVRIVSGYDFSALSPEANGEAILLLERGKAADGVRKAGEAFLKRPEASRLLLTTVLPIIAEGMPPKQRPDAYLKAAKMTPSGAVRAEMTEMAARSALIDRGDTAGALKLYQEVIQRYGAMASTPAIRLARIGLGDVHRVAGDYEKARKAYVAAGYGAQINVARLEITRGDYARHVEEYLRNEEFGDAMDFLERWERNIPIDKLEGYWSLLVVRMRLKQKRYDLAVRGAATLVKVNPGSNYAPQLLLHLAEAQRRLGKDDLARAALKQIVEEYPESPLAAEAARQLK